MWRVPTGGTACLLPGARRVLPESWNSPMLISRRWRPAVTGSGTARARVAVGDSIAGLRLASWPTTRRTTDLKSDVRPTASKGRPRSWRLQPGSALRPPTSPCACWYSVYEVTWNHAFSDVDIDHVVALSEAWRSGASTWTTSRRQQFANSLSDGQLLEVSDNVNSAKSDLDAAEWQSLLASYRCLYATQVVNVKYRGPCLSMDSAEKAAINSMLATC